MTTNPDSFRPLQRQAREELARQIDSGVPDAAKLVAQCGWSWNLAFALARAIRGEGANAAALQHEGIPAQAARGIADAIAARPAPVVAAAKSTSSGAKRGARPHPTYQYRGEI